MEGGGKQGRGWEGTFARCSVVRRRSARANASATDQNGSALLVKMRTDLVTSLEAEELRGREGGGDGVGGGERGSGGAREEGREDEGMPSGGI